ncbi:MAG: PHP domain-containing protein [Melioribacteraceae bacterium]
MPKKLIIIFAKFVFSIIVVNQKTFMQYKADLHTHTSFSDGGFTPTELIDLALQNNLSTISITDHDTVAGLNIALDYAKNKDIEVIPGIELSLDFDGIEVHILGYFIDDTNVKLLEYIEIFNNSRLDTAKKIIKRLNNLGMDITLPQVKEFSKNAPICRPHIAKTLLNYGHINNINQAYTKYIGDYSPAIVKKEHFPPEEVINIIKTAGGKSFIAHPGRMKEDIVLKLVKLGIDGIETIHPSHTATRTDYYKGIVNEYYMLESGGSDFHGGLRKDDNNFGKYFVEQSTVENIRKGLF